eukprot:m.208079 g.208079  ORF g.208079 m.208079 type:complete len:288 (-) comp15448_c0_seq5:2205-3068(-)
MRHIRICAAVQASERVQQCRPIYRRWLRYEVTHQSTISRARVGKIHLDSGRTIDTPTFVPVATTGAVRGIGMATTAVDATPLVFCNTLHMVLQPGADIVEAAGGLHAFTGRKNAIITDSGGFQIFSLAAGAMDLGDGQGMKGAGQRKRPSLVHKLTEDAVIFRSYLDGRLVTLSPESSIQYQKQLGADIIIPLDEVLPFNAKSTTVHEAFKRSHRWQYRSLQEHQRDTRQQAIYGGTCSFTRPSRFCERLISTLQLSMEGQISLFGGGVLGDFACSLFSELHGFNNA